MSDRHGPPRTDDSPNGPAVRERERERGGLTRRVADGEADFFLVGSAGGLQRSGDALQRSTFSLTPAVGPSQAPGPLGGGGSLASGSAGGSAVASAAAELSAATLLSW